MRLTSKLSRTVALAAAALLGGLAAGAAQATEMVYQPLNPSFGGNPLNGALLLQSAQATNKHKDPDVGAAGSPFTQQTPLQQFNDMLQRSVLSQLSSAAVSNVMSAGGKLVPGMVETTDFRINIADMGGGLLQITTTDKSTGASTSFQVGK